MILKPGASVGRGDMPAVAIRPIGVGIRPFNGIIPGIAIANLNSSDAQNSAMVKGMFAAA